MSRFEVKNGRMPKLKRRNSFGGNWKLLVVLLLAVLLLNLLGCASKSPVTVKCLPPPESPSLSTPLPSVRYSETAQQDMARWRKLLMDTPLTSQP